MEQHTNPHQRDDINAPSAVSVQWKCISSEFLCNARRLCWLLRSHHVVLILLFMFFGAALSCFLSQSGSAAPLTNTWNLCYLSTGCRSLVLHSWSHSRRFDAVISWCAVERVWRWGLYEAVKSSCEPGGCGTTTCWWASSWGAGSRERAPASRAQSAAGSLFPEHLGAERWSLAPLRERPRRWDRGGPAPFHHHDARPCDPARLCIWRREKRSQQGDKCPTVACKATSSPVDQNEVKCLSRCFSDSIPDIFQGWSPGAGWSLEPRISVSQTRVSICGLLSRDIVHFSKQLDFWVFPCDKNNHNPSATAQPLPMTSQEHFDGAPVVYTTSCSSFLKSWSASSLEKSRA